MPRSHRHQLDGASRDPTICMREGGGSPLLLGRVAAGQPRVTGCTDDLERLLEVLLQLEGLEQPPLRTRTPRLVALALAHPPVERLQAISPQFRQRRLKAFDRGRIRARRDGARRAHGRRAARWMPPRWRPPLRRKPRRYRLWLGCRL